MRFTHQTAPTGAGSRPAAGRRISWRWPVVSVAAVACLAVAAVGAGLPAAADDVTASQDSLRTGWDPNEASLSPAVVSSAGFGERFSTQLDGQVYAQPIVAGGMLLAVTENNWIYGLDPRSGAIRWSRTVGPAWPSSAIGCGDLAPTVGITSTPVYDPATATAYFTAKVDDGPDVNHPDWYLHAVDVTTGAERSGFPSRIGGPAANDPGIVFDARTAAQRPGLLLLGDVVYAGFASQCDIGPYVGYVSATNKNNGQQVTLWTSQADAAGSDGGIWQSGGGLVSDGPYRIFLTTGNGTAPPAGPGDAPPADLGESVVRLAVNRDGSLSAHDFFAPTNDSALNPGDTDLGSGGPMAVPDGYGTGRYHRLLIQVDKDGRVFLLNRRYLGGMGQGNGGTDQVLQTAGPYNGIWGHPAFWGAGTGYVYTIENTGPLRAFTLTTGAAGYPELTSAATAGTWGFTSGSPVVTSDGTTAGSGLVWAVYAHDGSGAGGQLRAYDAVPAGGSLHQVFSADIGTAAKFSTPATDAGAVYVGTRDGTLLGFGTR